MMGWIKRIFVRILQYENCVRTFTLSACAGIYIAFSPFIGFHTALVFLFSWLFTLNVSVVLAASVMINNPWSMVPVYGISYVFGERLLSYLGFNHYAWNPSWITKGNELLSQYVGFSGFSFWAFMIGGNLLGIGLALFAYPLIKYAATSMIVGKQKVVRTMCRSKEMVRSVATHAKQVAAAKISRGDRADYHAK